MVAKSSQNRVLVTAIAPASEWLSTANLCLRINTLESAGGVSGGVVYYMLIRSHRLQKEPSFDKLRCCVPLLSPCQERLHPLRTVAAESPMYESRHYRDHFRDGKRRAVSA